MRHGGCKGDQGCKSDRGHRGGPGEDKSPERTSAGGQRAPWIQCDPACTRGRVYHRCRGGRKAQRMGARHPRWSKSELSTHSRESEGRRPTLAPRRWCSHPTANLTIATRRPLSTCSVERVARVVYQVTQCSFWFFLCLCIRSVGRRRHTLSSTHGSVSHGHPLQLGVVGPLIGRVSLCRCILKK